MHLTIEIPPAQLRDVLPSERELAQAAGRGVSNIVKRRLVDRDRRGRSDGLPRTGYYGDAASGVTTEMSAKTALITIHKEGVALHYYGDAASGVTTEVNGSRAVVTIHKEGVALHYYGGVVYPTDGHKALAIPKSIQGAGKRPAEADPDRTKFALVWPKGKTTGTLRDKESGEVVYLLVPKATIPEDKTILPTESEMESAGMAAMEAIL